MAVREIPLTRSYVHLSNDFSFSRSSSVTKKSFASVNWPMGTGEFNAEE